jgi:hypothetical protein
MLSLSEACELAYAQIKHFENLFIIPEREKNVLGFKNDSIVWQIDTELLINRSLWQISFYIVFLSDFPLSLPKIYLTQSTFNSVKYIPHLDSNKFLCTFDETITRTDPENPVGVVHESIRKAKFIIEQGILQTNFEDFKTEFKAYWEQNYSQADILKNDIISLVDDPISNSHLTITEFSENYRGIHWLIHNKSNAANNLKKFLDSIPLRYEEFEALYLGELDLFDLPPHEITNKGITKIISLLPEDKAKSYQKYINNIDNGRVVIFSKNTGSGKLLIGWQHKPFVLSRPGFREGYLKPFSVINSFQGNDPVIRLAMQDYSSSRLNIRSTGSEEKKLKFAVVGLGSVGSHLVYFLNSLNRPGFYLIDNDKLEIENLGRHFLGFDYLKSYKTKSVQNFLLRQTPYQEISTLEESVVKVLDSDFSLFNSVDYNIIAVGKSNVERYFTSFIESGKIVKPTILIWVEPYLAGGHFIYLPSLSKDYSKHFDDYGFFKHNIISPAEYLKSDNDKLFKQESGCQSTYIPYSSATLVNFISLAFNNIRQIILNPPGDSYSYSWIGNKEFSQPENIQLSNLGEINSEGAIIINKI